VAERLAQEVRLKTDCEMTCINVRPFAGVPVCADESCFDQAGHTGHDGRRATMKISTWRSRRSSAIAIAAASMVLAAPAAQARPDEGGALTEPEQFVQGVTDFPSSVMDRPARGSDYGQFAYRRALPQDYVRTIQVAQRPGGFDWGDAGVGAGVALGAALLALRARQTVRAVKSGAYQ
jgi:hypothetical protein